MDRFSCLDILGNRINCTEEVWNNHILPDHPELRGYESYVTGVLARPKSIHKDKNNEKCLLYYGQAILPSLREPCFIRVAVKFRRKWPFRNQRGYVKTAFTCFSIRVGDELVWSEKK